MSLDTNGASGPASASEPDDVAGRSHLPPGPPVGAHHRSHRTGRRQPGRDWVVFGVTGVISVPSWCGAWSTPRTVGGVRGHQGRRDQGPGLGSSCWRPASSSLFVLLARLPAASTGVSTRTQPEARVQDHLVDRDDVQRGHGDRPDVLGRRRAAEPLRRPRCRAPPRPSPDAAFQTGDGHHDVPLGPAPVGHLRGGGARSIGYGMYRQGPLAGCYVSGVHIACSASARQWAGSA